MCARANVHIADICNWAGFLPPICYISRIHIYVAPILANRNLFFSPNNDKEKRQKAIAIAHEMARQKFIFNQLILILLQMDILHFKRRSAIRPAPSSNQKAVRACVCMHKRRP